MEKHVWEKVQAVWFIALATLMYYFLSETLNLGVFVTYRHVFAILIVISGVISFLIRPDLARGAVALRGALIYSLPLLVTVAVSLFIWFVDQVDVDIISRGLSGAFIFTNMLSSALAAATMLYIFGEKGIWYNLLALLIANFLMIGTIVAENGLGPYLQELWVLIYTFAGETGEIIVQAEIHELAFCLGAYLIFMVLFPKKKTLYFVFFGLGLFCFLCAFKRIGILAIGASLCLALFLKLIQWLRASSVKFWIGFVSTLLFLVLFAYIFVIKMDVFEMLQEAGVETSGRDVIYNAVDPYYEFSPEFLGHGIGFLTYTLSQNTSIGVSAVHNDFLQYYIDLGFFGYLFWLLAMTVGRVAWFGRKGRVNGAILTFTLLIYLVVASMTDNTINYPLLTCVLAILMMGFGFDNEVREMEEKLFGSVSLRNQKKKKENLL